jgi:NADPH2 dehydrogenase
MGMKDPLPTFTSFIERIRVAHPNFAYIHVIEPRINGNIEAPPSDQDSTQSNEALRKAAGNIPYIAAGGFDRASATTTVEKHGGLVAFGRHFIANVSNLVFITGLILARTSYYHSPISPCA